MHQLLRSILGSPGAGSARHPRKSPQRRHKAARRAVGVCGGIGESLRCRSQFTQESAKKNRSFHSKRDLGRRPDSVFEFRHQARDSNGFGEGRCASQRVLARAFPKREGVDDRARCASSHPDGPRNATHRANSALMTSFASTTARESMNRSSCAGKDSIADGQRGRERNLPGADAHIFLTPCCRSPRPAPRTPRLSAPYLCSAPRLQRRLAPLRIRVRPE